LLAVQSNQTGATGPDPEYIWSGDKRLDVGVRQSTIFGSQNFPSRILQPNELSILCRYP
jgi:hypothetical protein